MGRKIQFRRGTDADRQATVLANGEPGWSPEQQQFFIGDGVSKGGIATQMAHYKMVNNATAAIAGGRYLFTAVTNLQLPGDVIEGSSLTVMLDSSAGASKDNPARVLAPVGETIAKDGEAGSEYQMSKNGIERLFIFTNGGWRFEYFNRSNGQWSGVL